MGKESLYQMFLDDQVGNLQVVILEIGVKGLLEEYDLWLFGRHLIDRERLRGFIEEREKDGAN
jgi:hypothetical protein